VRALVIADSDSYVKWGAAVHDRMPARWHRTMVVIGSRAVPSAEQLATALAGSSLGTDSGRAGLGRPGSGRPGSATVPVVDLVDVADHVRRHRPDVVLMAVRGEVVRVLVRAIVAAAAEASLDRPVFVSGLPGISIPATSKALYYRSQVDYFLLHSKREIREFRALAEKMGIAQSFGLGTLPFLPERSPDVRSGGSIVFAAQAKVPREREDRIAVLRALADTAVAFPGRRVVIKVRAKRGETQTHAERYPFDDLLDAADLLAQIGSVPPNLVVEGGPMLDHLAAASGLVTVSSTAAIEAAAIGVPVIALDDFGVSPEMINLVFSGSGLLASSTDLRAGRFRTPEPAWLDDNYFHAEADNDWIAGIEALVRRRELGQLPLRPAYRGTTGGAVRRAWDRKLALGAYDRTVAGAAAYAVGVPLRSAVILARAPVRALRRRRTGRLRETAAAR
jgi:hypothetical protein